MLQYIKEVEGRLLVPAAIWQFDPKNYVPLINLKYHVSAIFPDICRVPLSSFM
jgi:hypothetical protein